MLFLPVLLLVISLLSIKLRLIKGNRAHCIRIVVLKRSNLFSASDCHIARNHGNRYALPKNTIRAIQDIVHPLFLGIHCCYVLRVILDMP